MLGNIFKHDIEKIQQDHPTHLSVAGTLVWYHLLKFHVRTESTGNELADSFYFAVVTFLTIGYGDIAPVTEAAKAFFIVYTVMSLVVQLTVVAGLVSTISMKLSELEDRPGGMNHVRFKMLLEASVGRDQQDLLC